MAHKADIMVNTAVKLSPCNGLSKSSLVALNTTKATAITVKTKVTIFMRITVVVKQTRPLCLLQIA